MRVHFDSFTISRETFVAIAVLLTIVGVVVIGLNLNDPALMYVAIVAPLALKLDIPTIPTTPKRIVMSFNLNDPAIMRRTVIAIIASLAMIIIGAVIITVSQAMGSFIVSTFQQAGTNVTVTTTYIERVAGIVGVGLTVTGAAIIVVIAVFILRSLIGVTTSIETG